MFVSKEIKIGNRTNAAAAGDGTPMKCSWTLIRTSKMFKSAVNLANLNAEQIEKIKTGIQPIDPTYLSDHKNIIIAGATPKDMKSLRLSNSAPNFEVLLYLLANQPSKKSNTVATIIKLKDNFHSCKNANLIEVKPLIRVNNETILAKLLNKFSILFFISL